MLPAISANAYTKHINAESASTRSGGQRVLVSCTDKGEGGGRGLLDDFLPMIAEKIATVVECKVNRRDAWVNETQGIRMLNVRGEWGAGWFSANGSGW